MKRYQVEVGAGAEARRLAIDVELDPAGGRARIVVAGRARTIELRGAGDGIVSWLDGSSSVFARVEGVAPKLTVFAAGTELPVRIDDARAAALAEVAGRVGARATGPAAVRAPIPGRLVKLLVKVGDAVKAQQPVAVVEAMKMENELRAPRDGLVDAVRVSEGAAVEAGQELIVLA